MLDQHWMQTYSGGQFFYKEGQPKSVSIIDIARSLSRLPRFLGHTSQYLSVAEHSMAVAQLLEFGGGSQRLQLLGLLHDAHEAYLGDIPSPLSHFLRDSYGVDLSAFKHHLQREILDSLGIAAVAPDEEAAIMKADMQALTIERRLVMNSNHRWHVDGVIVPEYGAGLYGYWQHDDAFGLFERHYDRLKASVDFETRVPQD